MIYVIIKNLLYTGNNKVIAFPIMDKFPFRKRNFFAEIEDFQVQLYGRRPLGIRQNRSINLFFTKIALQCSW